MYAIYTLLAIVFMVVFFALLCFFHIVWYYCLLWGAISSIVIGLIVIYLLLKSVNFH